MTTSKLLLQVLMVAALLAAAIGASCGRDEKVSKNDQELRMASDWRSQIEAAASKDPNEVRPAAIAVNDKGTDLQFLKAMCAEKGVEILGIEYFIRNFSTGIVRFDAKQDGGCDFAFVDLVYRQLGGQGAPHGMAESGAIPAEFRTSIRGLRVKASASTLLLLARIRPEIRAVRLYEDGIPMDIPWPNQPLSNAIEDKP